MATISKKSVSLYADTPHGECEMKNLAIANRLPLIHLQKEPIAHKSERARFDACAEGSLLILAPWPEDLDSMHSRTEMGGTGGGILPFSHTQWVRL